MFGKFPGMFLLTFMIFAAPARADDGVIYNRVMSTQTIRCGYAEWAPFLTVDPNTKKIGGLSYDLWEAIAKKLGLKLVWETPIGWGQVTEAYASGKIDAFCVGVWPDAGRMKNLLMSRPAFYMFSYLYAKAGDMRFDDNYAALDDPARKIIGQEGDITASILEQKFPHAATAHISPMDDQNVLFENVAAGKGDATISDVTYAGEFMKNNPGKIKKVKGPPIAIMQTVMPFARDEIQLKNMVDTVLTDMINDGTITALIKKYGAKETYAPAPDVNVPGMK